MNLAIVGHKGFVGKNLIERLVNKHPLRGFGREDTLNFYNVDCVIHLACDADSRNSNTHIESAVENNIGIFSKVLAEAIRKNVKRFIYVSSIEAETEHNVYAICKSACEKILRVSGMEYVIVRPCNLYGPYMDLKDKHRNVIANFMRCLRDKEPMEIIGDGFTFYQFTYIKTLIDELEKALTEYTHQTITVGNGPLISINELTQLLEGITTTWDWVKKQ